MTTYRMYGSLDGQLLNLQHVLRHLTIEQIEAPGTELEQLEKQLTDALTKTQQLLGRASVEEFYGNDVNVRPKWGYRIRLLTGEWSSVSPIATREQALATVEMLKDRTEVEVMRKVVMESDWKPYETEESPS